MPITSMWLDFARVVPLGGLNGSWDAGLRSSMITCLESESEAIWSPNHSQTSPRQASKQLSSSYVRLDTKDRF